jgi:hypothetical protein
MEAYPGDPYAYAPAGGGGGFSRRFHNIEGVLPLILLIVIAFFVLQFLGILPCIIPIGCGGDIDVLVIGTSSQGVRAVLTGDEARFRSGSINYEIDLQPDDILNVKILKNYKVVILQGQPYFQGYTREAIRSYVDGGGKLIVIEDAGSRHPEYPEVAGWDWPRGQGIPVPADIVGEEIGYSDIAYGSEIKFIDRDHPIAIGLKRLNANLILPSRVVKVTPEGNTVVAIKTDEGTWPAIIEGGSGLGTVVYFAYDPGMSPAVFLATVEWLGG